VTTRPPARQRLTRRTGTMTAAMLAAATLLTSAGVAWGAPKPTISQVRQQLDRLMSQQDQAVQQYDQTAQSLASARQRLALVDRGVTRTQAQFQAMRRQIAQLAAAAYENGTMTSAGALLTASNPQTVISQAALITHLSTDQATQMRQLVTAARALTAARQGAARTAQAVAALQRQQLARKRAVMAAVARQKSLLSSLTAQQQATVTVAAGGTTTGSYTGSTATQAGRAVAFAYNQLGKPYVYGATGPNAYDCSGLAQAAWAAAGVSIPRTTYAQWAALPHVPMSAIQPGDLLFFDAEGHVGIYVGGNMLIDAPQPGLSVEKVSLSNSWYASNLDGAARP
jgi:cell wall-associated NlpC family hydrolase